MSVRYNNVTLDNVARISQNESRYNYIIVGSGMGGGTLSRMLVEEHKQNVLLIERGGIRFNTHCLNTSRPHWNHETGKGPTQDNDIVYKSVKEPVPVAGGSYDYAGGPVYCLGGRSNVWGLYCPGLQESYTRDHFPAAVAQDLARVINGSRAIEKAYQLVTGSLRARHDAPYPEDVLEDYRSISDKKAVLQRETGLHFTFAPIAAEFIPPDHCTSQLYRFPAGAYSTVDWLLNGIYNNDPHLTVLLDSEVITINKRSGSLNDCGVHSLTVRQNGETEQIFCSSAKAVILCAGTIDTAHIAIRSGMKDMVHENVGRGLTDHSIWGTRFEILQPGGQLLPPLKMQAWWKLPNLPSDCPCITTGSSCTAAGNQRQCCCSNPRKRKRDNKAHNKSQLKCEGDPVLINICINANTFLGHSLENKFPVQCLDNQGQRISLERATQETTNTVNITFEFTARLENSNCVLTQGQRHPLLNISHIDENSACYELMKEKAQEIMEAIDTGLEDVSNLDLNNIRLHRADFGEVAHEVGTMRMGDNNDQSAVVDENLKVRKWQNLYVCDLSVFPDSPAANPSLTLIALAMRLADYLVKKAC